MAKDLPRLAILGAGPIGLEAALYARTLNHAVQIYERGQVGEYWQRWGHVRLFSPFRMNGTALGRAAILAVQPKHEFPDDDAMITGREHRTVYLQPLSQVPLLQGCLQVETNVIAVGRHSMLKDDEPGETRRGKQPFRLLLRDNKGRERVEEADIVLDCTGTYGQHRWLGDGGIPAAGELAAEANIAYGLEDIPGERKGFYAGKNVLVVGTGYSAATSVCSLAELAVDNLATWVFWLARGSSTQPIKRVSGDPLRERDRLAVRANTLATRSDGNVEFHPQSLIDSIDFAGPDKGFRVAVHGAGQPRTFEVDRIIGNVGYVPDRSLYRELHVQDRLTETGPSEGLGTSEPGFYIVGAKANGRDSGFLLSAGFDQVRDVFAKISGNPRLDLFKKK